MSHASQTDLGFLPKRLVGFCYTVVEEHHKTHGYSGLAARLWDKNTLVVMAIHKDLLTLINAASATWKISAFCFVVGGGLVVLSFVINWSIILGLIPLFFITRYFVESTHRHYKLMSALMLALEIAGSNFRELFTHSPEVQAAARGKLQECLSGVKTRFLDFYLPLRDEASPEIYKKLATVIEKEFDFSPTVFQEIYLRTPGVSYRAEAQEVVDLLVRAGIGVGIYGRHPRPDIFWRKAAVAANQLYMWLEQNEMANQEERLAQARRVVDMNHVVHRSLRMG
jgi:hypothetical protein